MNNTSVSDIPEPRLARLLFANSKSGIIWLLVRLYVAWQWLQAGWEKLQSPAWFGSHAGTALHGFLLGALQKAQGPHPDVAQWYIWFLQHIVIPHVTQFSYVVTFGELAVGVALLLGLCTGIAAFFGSVMNFNFLLAGAISINPLMFLCELFLILAWRVAGWYGLDRYVLPVLGTPWQLGTMFRQEQS